MRRTTPLENIVAHEHFITAFNLEKVLRDRKFVVQLACGHRVYTSAIYRAVCPRCTEMLKRSIEDGSEDYESFRQGKTSDTMRWSDDPCRQFNERAR